MCGSTNELGALDHGAVVVVSQLTDKSDDVERKELLAEKLVHGT